MIAAALAVALTVPTGAYYPPTPYDTEALYAGHAKVARVFDANRLDTWGDYPAIARAYGQGVRTFVVSWKGTDVGDIRDFAATVPAGVTVYGTFLHEPENDIESGRTTLAEWKAQTVAQAKVMREVGIRPMTILMGWTLFPARSGRRVADYDLPAGTVDVAGFDAHVRDKDPARMAKKLRREVRRTGIPTAVPETSGRPANLRALLDGLPAKTRFVCWFSRTGITERQSRVMFGGAS